MRFIIVATQRIEWLRFPSAWKGQNLVTDAAKSAADVPIGLCVYGIAYTAGFVGRGTPRANPHPLDAIGFLELAAKLGLSAIELPFAYIHPQEDEVSLRAYVEAATERGLRVISAGLPIEIEPFRRDRLWAGARPCQAFTSMAARRPSLIMLKQIEVMKIITPGRAARTGLT